MLYYEMIGNTKENVVLFLHGWGADCTSFRGVVFNLPKNDVSYMLVDFPGFGKSEEPTRSYSVLDYAEEIITLLDNLKISKVTIVGHSFGGRIGIVLASKFSERVKKLILVDSAGVIEGRGLYYHLKVGCYKLKVKLFGREKVKLSGSDDYKALKSDVMRETFKKVVNEDLLDLSKNIKTPTVLIWGDKDKATSLKAGRKLNKAIKNSKLVVLKGAGHFCFLDKPTEFVYILYESIFL